MGIARRCRALACVAGLGDALEVLLELRDAALDAPAVDLELRLARTPGADAAALLAEGDAAAAQAGQPVAELGELDLEHPGLTGGVLGEDVHDQGDPVDDVPAEALLEVPLLGGRELVVEDDDVDVVGVGGAPQLLGLAGSDVGRGVGPVAALQHGLDGLGAHGVGQSGELVERGLGRGRGAVTAPVPTSKARWRTTSRSISVAVSRRRARPGPLLTRAGRRRRRRG